MTIDIFVLKRDLNGENGSGAFLFCRVYMYLKYVIVCTVVKPTSNFLRAYAVSRKQWTLFGAWDDIFLRLCPYTTSHDFYHICTCMSVVYKCNPVSLASYTIELLQ